MATDRKVSLKLCGQTRLILPLLKNVFFSLGEVPFITEKTGIDSVKYFIFNIRCLIPEDIASSTDANTF